jgi:AcrR family transcriptional regulator
MNSSFSYAGTVVRQRPPGFVDQLVGAAARVFATKGYRLTQMADVAQELGVAPGTLYGYVESKEALFYLVIDRCSPAPGFERPLPALPVPTPPPGATLARFEERVAELAPLPLLRRAARRRLLGDPVVEVTEVLGELYDATAASRLLADAVERSAADVPALAVAFYSGARRRHVALLRRWIARRCAEGVFGAVTNEQAVAVLINESVYAFARHRPREPDRGLDEKTARAALVQLFARGLLADAAG